ncbi:MAG TPA: hydrogen peroxide-dependent heme synthase [Gemmatimonadaceae bacterium]|nr:hydrogen peroxide-dependent heme synthase [Gemmatimonadaceae bacterium]
MSTTAAIPEAIAHPPETLEGWYALHQLFSIDRAALRARDAAGADEQRDRFRAMLTALASPGEGGWSAPVRLIGSRADLLLMHFRPTLDALGAAQRCVAAEPAAEALRLVSSFLSITEAGLYHVTAQLARDAAARGGAIGDATYAEALAERVQTERSSAHIQRRLYPPLPPEMPYVSFYPMSKRRAVGQNWYALSLDERSQLMYSHGKIGRRYAGKVMQVISGAIGLDVWEWGVTLFARDPLDFKKLVTDMRFDEASAQYAEFGEFFVGKVVTPAEAAALL